MFFMGSRLLCSVRWFAHQSARIHHLGLHVLACGNMGRKTHPNKVLSTTYITHPHVVHHDRHDPPQLISENTSHMENNQVMTNRWRVSSRDVALNLPGSLWVEAQKKKCEKAKEETRESNRKWREREKAIENEGNARSNRKWRKGGGHLEGEPERKGNMNGDMQAEVGKRGGKEDLLSQTINTWSKDLVAAPWP